MSESDGSLAPRVRGVLDVARLVLSDLDVEVVLTRVLEAARELSGASYAALGVLDRSRGELDRFLTSGIDEVTRGAIGALPRGRGVLGELIRNPVPLRLTDVGAHPHSYGFPPGHPPMRSFLGVPVIVDGEPFGNLYLTEKVGGQPFTADDEFALVLLADFAGVAIDHARRYAGVESQRSDLQRTVEALDATVRIAQAVGGETDLDLVLELVAKRGRALVSARALVIERQLGGELEVAAAAGEVPAGIVGQRVDSKDSVASGALRALRTLRLEDETNQKRFERHGLGRLGLHASGGLVVPLVFRGRGYGVLVAIDRLIDGPAFTADDQRLLEAFAASAATAVATAVSVEAERQSQRLAAAEQERTRWARELHDETLQNLAGLRIAMGSQLRTGDPESMVAAITDAVDLLDAEISNLRSLIADLRPATLDDLGLGPAIEDLAERARGHGLDVDLSLDLAYEQRREHERLSTELETALYRITQEALTNARKHGAATRAVIELHEYETSVQLMVRDDGQGFEPAAKTDGFGLIGMRERAELLAGRVEVDSTRGQGTTVTASFPVRRASAAQAS
jgi:signal transduction histidine kinase